MKDLICLSVLLCRTRQVYCPKLVIYTIFCSILLISCVSKKNTEEYIQFKHENIMVIKGDKLIITLIPTISKRKKSVIVKTLKNNEPYDNKRITNAEYKKIYELVIKTSQKDIELPQSPNRLVSIVDGGNNSIIIKKDSIEKKLSTHGISKEYHRNFFEAVELILKSAKLTVNDIN
ncbi:hypothetical protein N0B40_19835 [Chryseobacterium oranimense]|uniref:hypothetical protein n=1 Tax=Chryseobacterium oranimense TaxID=421058 RepID=UPI0021AF277C|nr:hypothetical protein [Chryseobacterium oranimense]UWX60625.1 hypothetical protein N0B40_19835 [Chryseobacterium oranimense]